MAEGGDFAIEQPELDKDLDNKNGDDQYDFNVDTEIDTTKPFVPGTASTPYHGGEQIELLEQSGLPSFDEDIPLLGDRTQ